MSWAPTWIRDPLRALADKWVAITTPYAVDYGDPDGGVPYALRVLRFTGGVGLAWAVLTTVFMIAEFVFVDGAQWMRLRALGHLLSYCVLISSGTTLFLVSRVHRRRFAVPAVVLLFALLALTASPLLHFGWSATVAVAVPSLLALLSYWKELDP